MVNREQKIRFRVIALAVVYFLRMAFFQTMIASPAIFPHAQFKISLAQHQSKNQSSFPVVHRSHVQKHTSGKDRFEVVLPAEMHQDLLIIRTEPEKYSAIKLYNPPVFSHLANDALERYRLHRTFLI